MGLEASLTVTMNKKAADVADRMKRAGLELDSDHIPVLAPLVDTFRENNSDGKTRITNTSEFVSSIFVIKR